MPNWCSVAATLRCVSEDDARMLVRKLNAERAKAKAKRRAMFWGSDDCYLFNAEVLPLSETEVQLTGEVRWSIPEDAALEIIEWLRKQGEIADIQINYEESGFLLYGVYRWNRDTGVIVNEYLPDEYWPAWQDKDDDYIERLEDAFSEHCETAILKCS